MAASCFALFLRPSEAAAILIENKVVHISRDAKPILLPLAPGAASVPLPLLLPSLLFHPDAPFPYLLFYAAGVEMIPIWAQFSMGQDGVFTAVLKALAPKFPQKTAGLQTGPAVLSLGLRFSQTNYVFDFRVYFSPASRLTLAGITRNLKTTLSSTARGIR